MQTIWLLNLGLVVTAIFATSLESNTVTSHQRPKRQYLTFTPPHFQFTLGNNTGPWTFPITKYQQPLQLPFAFPFNWPFSLIPGVVSNQLVGTTTAKPGESPNDLGAVDPRKDTGKCGKASLYLQATTRIVDGGPAQYGEFPFLVAIMRDDGKTHLCGGSLISDRYILSAAHCYANYQVTDVSRLRVYIGDYNIYDPNDVPNQVRSVTRLIRHSKWNNSPNFNDVALLKLDRPVTFNDYVQPICLARGTEASFYSSGTVATVAGWGKVQWGNPELQRTPLKISIPLVDKNTCQRSMYPHAIGDSMICAGAGYKSTCLGDSGGPLAIYSDGRWHQIGIVSWGLNCNGYGIYSRVSSFSNWIYKYSKA